MRKMEFIMLDSMEKLTPALIDHLVTKHRLEAVPRIRHLRKYYEGQHAILKRTFKDASKPNNKIVNNFCRMITDVTQGYFMGEPITYTSDDEKFLMHLEDLYNVNTEENQNSLLAKDASIFGVGYELLYMNEDADICMTTLPPEEVLMIYNTKVDRKPIGAIRHYIVKDYLDPTNDVEYVEVYTETHIMKYFAYSGGTLIPDGIEEHYFGVCPVIPYCNNDEELGDFEGIIAIQDAYNAAVSDQANDFEYTADSYLVITGAQDTEDAEFLNMKQNRLILLPEEGEAKWLIKKTDNQTLESYKKRLTKDIHRFSNVPDINSDEFMSDISGVALKYRWQAMEQACANKERLFKESLYQRQKAICNILSIKGLHFDFGDVKPHFKRNLPVNMNEVIQLVASLRGTLSQETLLAQLPFLDSVQDELDRIEEEQDDPYNDFGAGSEQNPVGDIDLPIEEETDEEEPQKGAWNQKSATNYVANQQTGRGMK